GVGGNENALRRLTVLRAIDKADKFPIEEIRKLLGEGRKDESGDFTKGAGLSDEQAEAVLAYVGSKYAVADGEGGSGWAAAFEGWRRVGGKSETGPQGLEELAEMAKLFWSDGYGYDRISFDSSVVRGLEYYTGPVYEVELTLETKDEKGRP